MMIKITIKSRESSVKVKIFPAAGRGYHFLHIDFALFSGTRHSLQAILQDDLSLFAKICQVE
jgi:hypothetical protein